MSYFKKIFVNSPIWLQNLMISLYGYQLYRKKYGAEYVKAYNKYINTDYSNVEEQNKIQFEELKRIISYAKNYSPFYKEFYKNINIDQITCISDITKLPIMEKEIFRKNLKNIYTVSEKEGIVSYTGGTTGKALKVIFCKNDFQKRMAYLDAFKQRVGIDPFKTTKATFSGREFTNNKISKRRNIYWRYNFFYRQKFYSTFDMVETNLPYYVEDLNKFKPRIINGFVSAIYDLATYIKRNDIKLKFIPEAIFTTSETLLPLHRERIESVFMSKIFNQYASSEGAPFITECLCGNLHYNIDTGVIEVYKTNNGPEMLVTSFTSYGTPLIRYQIGDSIRFKEGKCECGSCHPLVEAIEGRQVDYLYSKERGKVSLSHLADVIKGLPGSIKKMQFIQDNVSNITIKLVVDESIYNENHDEASIINEMKYRFGNNMKIRINRMDDIPNEKSGKYALIKNTIDTPTINNEIKL
jgi:phenylacetate-CoA ligase